MSVKLPRWFSAHGLQFWLAERRDTSETEMRQSVEPLQEPEDGGDRDIFAVGQMDPLKAGIPLH